MAALILLGFENNQSTTLFHVGVNQKSVSKHCILLNYPGKFDIHQMLPSVTQLHNIMLNERYMHVQLEKELFKQ